MNLRKMEYVSKQLRTSRRWLYFWNCLTDKQNQQVIEKIMKQEQKFQDELDERNAKKAK